MAKILILGGYGFTGRSLAKHLMEQSTAEIVLAGRHVDRARLYTDELNSKYGGKRVSAIHVDAADAESLRDALGDVDIMVVAAPATKYSASVIRTALECGVDYLDVQFSADKLAILRSLGADIKRSGRCFITEAGFHPGLPSAMVRYAASQFDRIETAATAGYLNMGKDLPFSDAVDELMEAFKDYNTQVFHDGKWIDAGWIRPRRVNFEGEIGVRQCYPMYFEEMRQLPEMYPTLTDTGFYICGTHWFVDWVITPLVMAGLKIAPKKSVRPMGRLMWWGMRTFSKPPYVVLLRVDATGTKNGKQAAFHASVSHKDGYELTAIPVAAALLQYLDGTARKPGLWMMGHLVEPGRLFSDMAKMGVAVESSFETEK